MLNLDSCVEDLIARFGVTDATRRFLSSTQGLYIDGRFCQAEDGALSDVIEPGTASVLARVPAAAAADVDRAVGSARSAFTQGAWAGMKPGARERLLHRLADLVEAHAQTLAEIESLNNGKAIAGCLPVDILGSVDVLRYMAGWPSKIEGATRAMSAPGEHFAYTLKSPLGVVGAIVPWNWPFAMMIWKLAGALASGCTMVIKPAQITPLSALYFAQLCELAGVPPGVVNIVTGSGSSVGHAIATHPGIDKLSFTGSTAVGKQIAHAAVDGLTHTTLELGGKSPMLVFDDADIEAVVAATQQSIFYCTGQVCSAGSRLYAQRGVYDRVVQAVAERAASMRIGVSLDPSTEVGPMASRAQQRSVMEYVDIGRREGASVRCGGEAIDGPGAFMQPTVFAGCHNTMRIVQEEIFGPVLCCVSFDDEADALRLANDNVYGLAASIFTRDLSRAQRLVPRLQAGTVWVNTHDLVDAALPFGGVKQSGFGKDMGPEQLDHYLHTKAVWVRV